MDQATLQHATRIAENIGDLDFHLRRLQELRCPSAAVTQELFEQFKKDANSVISEARKLLVSEFSSL